MKASAAAGHCPGNHGHALMEIYPLPQLTAGQSTLLFPSPPTAPKRRPHGVDATTSGLCIYEVSAIKHAKIILLLRLSHTLPIIIAKAETEERNYNYLMGNHLRQRT
jgi:hypothetical protein